MQGKRVLVRADLNVPMDGEGNITDDTRIRAAVPTLKYLVDNGAKVLLTSHLVRPSAMLSLVSGPRSCYCCFSFHHFVHHTMCCGIAPGIGRPTVAASAMVRLTLVQSPDAATWIQYQAGAAIPRQGSKRSLA